MARKRKPSPERPPDWTRSELLDAAEQWTEFALPPLQMQVPVAWAPRVSNWTQQAAHIRWESLTGTPLEFNWMVMKSDGQETAPDLERRLGMAWDREIKAAEKQSKQSGIEVAWKGEARALDRYVDLDVPGKAREYFWHGQLGCLAVFTLHTGKTRLYVAASICGVRLRIQK